MLVLFVVLSAPRWVHAQAAPDGPTTSGGASPLLEDDKHKTSIFKNLLLYYRKTREWAKTYINAVNSVSDLLYGCYSMLKKWEDISKKVVWLYSTNPFSRNPTTTIENLEGWFRTSDAVLFKDVPSAMAQRKQLQAQQLALINSFKGGGQANVGAASAQAYADAYQKGYLDERGLKKSPGKDGRVFLTPADEVLQNIIKQNARMMAEAHEQTLIIQQEDAVSSSVGQDMYDMVNCSDSMVCGGVTERADADNRMGMLASRRVQMARRQADGTNQALLQDVLSTAQVYVTGGVLATAGLGAVIGFEQELAKENGLTDQAPALASYRWGSLYPTAYRYDGAVYGPDVHYYDNYK